MKVYKTEGIIIKRTNYSEADRILTIFTKHYGKIKVLAKGVRRITSRRSGNVELLNLAEIILHESHNFDILTEATVKKSFPKLRKNLTKIAWAYHICELIDGLCPEKQENKKIFELVVNTLSLLNYEEDKKLESTIREFESSLLRDLGFWPRDKVIPHNSSRMLIEQILERKLKSKNFLEKIN